MRNRRQPRASFTYEISADNIVQIFDEDKGMSVTNDIENVLSEISELENRPLTGSTVIYRDTMGNWDGVTLTSHGTFGGFYPVHETDLQKALEKVRAKRG